jgi:tape measure domain-containing protein
VASDNLSFTIVGDVDASALTSQLKAALSGSAQAAREFNKELEGNISKKVIVDFDVNAKGLDRVNILQKESLSAFDKIAQKFKQRENLEEGSLTRLRQQVNQAKQLRDQIAKTSVSIGEYGRQVTGINPKWDAANAKVQTLQRELNAAGASNFWERLKSGLNAGGFLSVLNGVTQLTNGLQSVSIVVGQAISSFSNLSKALSRVQQFGLSFKAIGATQGEFQQALDESSRIALGLGANLGAAREALQQLSPIILTIGGSISDVSAVTEALSSRFAALGLGADKSRRVLNGIIQAFGKGRLQAEELTQQIAEADPAFRVDLASAIGVTSKELGELVSQGEITDRVLLEILPKLSKSSLLFGKLGESASSAAAALRKDIGGSGVTIEQFKNQLETIQQLNLEQAAKALEPLLVSLAELKAGFVDLGTVIVSSEAFATLAGFVNSLSSQFSAVVQVIGKFLNVIFQVADLIFKVVNAIDDLTERFTGFRLITGTLAALITTKLVVALGALAIKGVSGLVVAGMKAMTIATGAYATAGLGGTIKTIGLAIANFTGLKASTLAQVKADFAAVASTRARTAAIAQLRAIEATSPITAGASSVNLLAQAAAQRAVAKTAAEAAASSSALGSAAIGAGAAGRTGAIGLGALGASAGTASTGLVAGIASAGKIGAVLGVLALKALPVLLVIGGIAAAFGAFSNSSSDASNTAKDFTNSYDGIVKRTNEAINALNQASNSTATFEDKLSNLRVTADKEFNIKINFGRAQKEADEVIKRATSAFTNAQRSVREYSEELDKTGVIGEKNALRIAAAEQINANALDALRAKRDELTDRATKGGDQISRSNQKQLAEYQKNIEALEKQRDEFAKIRQQAREKGIPVKVSTAEAQTVVKGLEQRIKDLQAQILLEVDPAKFSETQSKINGLQQRLEFLKADRVKIQIDLSLNTELTRLNNAATLAKGILDNIQSAVDLASAQKNLASAALTGQEQDRNENLRLLRERLEGEKEVRDERLNALEEAKASEAQIAAVKKANQEADKQATETIKAEEEKIRQIQEQKRGIEAAAIQARLNALPAIQDAETRSLQIAQQLRRLEQERLLLAQKRRVSEAEGELQDLERQRAKAVDKKDFTKAEDIQRDIDLQRQNLAILKEETKSLEATSRVQEQLDKLEKDSLTNKQKAAELAIKAEQAALGQVDGARAAAAGAQELSNNLEQSANQTQQTQGGLAGIRDQISVATSQAADLRQEIQGAGDVDLSGPGNQARSAFAQATTEADQLKQTISQVPEVPTEGLQGLDETLGGLTEDANAFGGAVRSVGEGTQALGSGATSAADALGTGQGRAEGIAGSLANAASQANDIVASISGLDGLSVSIKVNSIPGLWTGGPAQAGQTYQVNELGQEGFLSATGRLSPINKPRNALWKAPTSGTVIPANIWSNMNIPKTGIQTTGRPIASVVTGGNGELAKISRQIQMNLMMAQSSQDNDELASVQAQQAIEIGKLGRAVEKLTSKKWNVQVGVTNTGNSAYLNAVNHRL